MTYQFDRRQAIIIGFELDEEKRPTGLHRPIYRVNDQVSSGRIVADMIETEGFYSRDWFLREVKAQRIAALKRPLLAAASNGIFCPSERILHLFDNVMTFEEVLGFSEQAALIECDKRQHHIFVEAAHALPEDRVRERQEIYATLVICHQVSGTSRAQALARLAEQALRRSPEPTTALANMKKLVQRYARRFGLSPPDIFK